MTRDIKNLPYNIYKFRTERKLTHEELAELLGVSVRIIYDYENGKKTPKLTTLFDLSIILQTTLDELISK